MGYFDERIDRGPRSGSFSSKWQGFEESFPGYCVKGALPMWVADMDFLCPREIQEAVERRARHGIFGYASLESVQLFKEAARDWYWRRNAWQTETEWMLFVPAVVPAINAAIQEWTSPGDGIIIQTPVYQPFMNSIRNNNRKICFNPLIEEEGQYRMDFNGLEMLASRESNKMLILCSPHNPVGRVWTREELQKVLDICRRWNVLIFSDEIHADIVMYGHKNMAMGRLTSENDLLISACSPSKTFNIAGLQASLLIISNPELRNRIQKRTVANRLPYSNIFGPIAGEAAYRYGDSYADQLTGYLENNFQYVDDYCKKNLPNVSMTPAEGTYLAWMDFRGLGLEKEALNRLILEKAKLALDLGEWFGEEGIGFMRMNLACPLSRVQEAMERLHRAL